MNKREFIQQFSILTGGLFMTNITSAASYLANLSKTGDSMPVLFLGHGSPMNAIEDNQYTRGWKDLVKDIPTPKAIVCISAHWETRGTKVTAMQNPRMIYDMSGFPQKLYEVVYNAPGNPELAKEIINTIQNPTIEEDHKWGFDHGTWSVLTHAFPNADIPLIQLSLDRTRDLKYHYNLGKQLAFLREKGVLIVGSGNIVHNLPMIFQTGDRPADWAFEFDNYIEKSILNASHSAIINYSQFGKAAELSVNSAEHFIPLLYILACQKNKDAIVFANTGITNSLLGIGMRCVKIG